MNKVLLPSVSTWSLIRLRNPAPAERTKITVPMPIIMPSIVNIVRPGFARSALIDCLNAFIIPLEADRDQLAYLMF